MPRENARPLVDDLDGSTSSTVAVVRFELDNVSYEINLSAANAEALRATLSEFVAHARRISPVTNGSAGPGSRENSAHSWSGREPSPIYVPAALEP
jgi:hypothetical protein